MRVYCESVFLRGSKLIHLRSLRPLQTLIICIFKTALLFKKVNMNNNSYASHCPRKLEKPKAYLVKNWVMIPEGLLSIMAWKDEGRFTIAEDCFSLVEHCGSSAADFPLSHSLYLRTFNYCFLNIFLSYLASPSPRLSHTQTENRALLSVLFEFPLAPTLIMGYFIHFND